MGGLGAGLTGKNTQLDLTGYLRKKYQKYKIKNKKCVEFQIYKNTHK